MASHRSAIHCCRRNAYKALISTRYRSGAANSGGQPTMSIELRLVPTAKIECLSASSGSCLRGALGDAKATCPRYRADLNRGQCGKLPFTPRAGKLVSACQRHCRIPCADQVPRTPWPPLLRHGGAPDTTALSPPASASPWVMDPGRPVLPWPWILTASATSHDDRRT